MIFHINMLGTLLRHRILTKSYCTLIDSLKFKPSLLVSDTQTCLNVYLFWVFIHYSISDNIDLNLFLYISFFTKSRIDTLWFLKVALKTLLRSLLCPLFSFTLGEVDFRFLLAWAWYDFVYLFVYEQILFFSRSSTIWNIVNLKYCKFDHWVLI